MTKALAGLMFVMMTAGVVGAQEESAVPSRTNAAAEFSGTSASQVSLLAANNSASAAGNFALANPGGEAGALPEAPAAPAAKPRYIFGDRDDFRWQLGVGVEFFRFQSNVIDSSMAGMNTTLTYYTNSWFAVEGNVITGFAPTIYQNEHVKLVGGGGGLRIGGRRARWEPWGHALVGGSHLQPQTAAASRNSLMVQAGAGVDFRVYARLSLRLEGDWVYTQYFHQTQNNFEGVTGIVLHF
jgi:hypothetical protein